MRMSWDRDNMVSNQSIRGVSRVEIVWESVGGGRGSQQLRGGVFEGDAHHLFGEMSGYLGGDSGAILLRHREPHLLSNNNRGAMSVTVQVLATSAWHDEALVSFMSSHDAERARSATHGHNIYDGCCQLDIQYAQPLFGGNADVTPTKCSTLGSSRTTTRSTIESSPTASSHVFPAAMNSSTPSTTIVGIAIPPPSIKTDKVEGDMAQVEMKPEETPGVVCQDDCHAHQHARDMPRHQVHSVQSSFNNPWFGHRAISVVYLTCYGCLDRSSEYTASSSPVPPWREAIIPWNKAEMTLGSWPLPWPDPQLSQGSKGVVMKLLWNWPPPS
uniref:PTBP1-like RNA recognition motif 2 domain-containing protein n=1 Tax=Oryza glumipatula TaxID=40148 RepID=A0A0E0BT14_9ORYZ